MKEIDPVPAEPRSPDEAGETSGVLGDARVVQERGHDSDSSGLAVDDPARAGKRRRQYGEGATEVSETD